MAEVGARQWFVDSRHVLTANGQARSIVSDCGKKGKCLNGQCVLDRCLGITCAEGELCRDGDCVKVAETFCLGHADCGPDMDCRSNRCRIRTPEPICNCQPHEICHHGQCYPNTQCTSIFCGKGSYCVDGKCVNGIGVDCREENCRGGTACVNGVCVLDPCPASCPADQSCRLGECRIMEGLPCVAECSGPYTCVDGHCRRNDCERRVCQLGEACEGGQCHKVTGRFCTWAPRDCGHAFSCKDNQCVDLLTPAATIPPHQDNQLSNK
ncbi:Hemadin protein [Necator americanus]|uniref:Hemadin protein n=1 Tax=Necator americanus TaxID=51031 RepID=W2TT01_NECAM|nr:Hemadin protein [Necator americanus]ETN84893.1 Hemadin protein [Necator americanus]